MLLTKLVVPFEISPTKIKLLAWPSAMSVVPKIQMCVTRGFEEAVKPPTAVTVSDTTLVVNDRNFKLQNALKVSWIKAAETKVTVKGAS